MSLEEFGGNLPANRLQGDFIGKVDNIQDPERLMRVRVRVVGVHTSEVPDASLPWAEYLLPTGCRADSGAFKPAKPGDYVWIDFPYQGDPRRPRIKGSVHYAPGNTPTLPAPAFGADYHETMIVRGNGVTVEVKPNTTVHITQDGTGATVTIDPDGKIRVQGNAVAIDGLLGEGTIGGILQEHHRCQFHGMPFNSRGVPATHFATKVTASKE